MVGQFETKANSLPSVALDVIERYPHSTVQDVIRIMDEEKLYDFSHYSPERYMRRDKPVSGAILRNFKRGCLKRANRQRLAKMDFYKIPFVYCSTVYAGEDADGLDFKTFAEEEAEAQAQGWWKPGPKGKTEKKVVVADFDIPEGITRGFLESLTIAKLKTVCKVKGIKGFSKYKKKSELVEFMCDTIGCGTPPIG